MNSKYFKFLMICLVFLAIISQTGCKKYLDQQPITDVGPELVFKDVGTTYQALIAVYSRLTGDAGYGIRLSLYYPVDNDEMQGPTGAGNDLDRRDIARYAATPANGQLEAPFNQLFRGIEYANVCIDQIPKMALYSSGSDQEKKQLQRMLGEAYTLRAQFYFEAIRNWGDLPAHFKPAYQQASENPLPGKTDRDTLYNHLIEDLRIAAELVPWRNDLGSIGDANNERITKGTVKALRARISLFRAGYSLRGNTSALGTMQRGSNSSIYYQIARDECFDIMNSGQHKLNPSFKALWKDQVGAHVSADPDGELMFQVSGIGGGSAADTKLGYYNGPRANNFGNSSISPLPTYFYQFDPNDTRLFVTIAPYNVNLDGTKAGLAASALNDGKYRRDWITPAVPTSSQAQYFQTKWQILRYSDVLLMFAEAENEIKKGPNDLAYNAINMVRRRAFGKSLTTPDPTVDLPAGLSQTAFFDAIVKERSLELGGEGIRKYDLIRWNLLASKIAETKVQLQAFTDGTGQWANIPTRMFFFNGSFADDKALWSNSFYTTAPTSTPAGTTAVNWRHSSVSTGSLARFATGFQTGRSELLPLPAAAVRDNINLKQNPGY